MGRIKQGISVKRKATRKDKKSKYLLATNRFATQRIKNGKQENKYGYARKIYKVAKANKYSYKR